MPFCPDGAPGRGACAQGTHNPAPAEQVRHCRSHVPGAEPGRCRGMAHRSAPAPPDGKLASTAAPPAGCGPGLSAQASATQDWHLGRQSRGRSTPECGIGMDPSYTVEPLCSAQSRTSGTGVPGAGGEAESRDIEPVPCTPQPRSCDAHNDAHKKARVLPGPVVGRCDSAPMRSGQPTLIL